jgi:hypothetical protein
MASVFDVMENHTVPMHDQRSTCEGVVFGITRPYNKPWDIAPIRASNEPAKPPLPQGD